MKSKYSFQQLNRRVHLYLGMFCLPWFVMFGITSIPINHPIWFNDGKGQPGGDWTEVQAWPCTVTIPSGGEISRETTRELVRVAGLNSKAFGAYRAGPNKINVYLPHFREMKQLTYWTAENRLVLLERKKFMRQFLGGLHTRGGYHQDSLGDDLWAFIVDGVCIAFLLWVTTGLFMWWRIPTMRVWGSIALLGGFLVFAGFMIFL